MESTQTILPKPVYTASIGLFRWRIKYRRNPTSVSSVITQMMEYGNDLSGWTPINLPASCLKPVGVTH